ncbi:hypothetical protein MTP99_008390 [Tenebrio molitor]|jgi:hypothetical protein|nr:hypothetical protein MTP99_008390 [Tenebrio molitor]
MIYVAVLEDEKTAEWALLKTILDSRRVLTNQEQRFSLPQLYCSNLVPLSGMHPTDGPQILKSFSSNTVSADLHNIPCCIVITAIRCNNSG